MTAEDRIWLLISRAVSGDISREELEELEYIFHSNPELRSDYENLKSLKFTSQSSVSQEERAAIDKGIEKFNESITREQLFNGHEIFNPQQLTPMGSKTHIWWMAAASLFVALTVSGYLLYRTKNTTLPARQIALATNYGKRLRSILPDGSVVWLNGGSTIKYTQNLNTNGKREVVLNGEAFFDVKHDTKHPFIVHAGKMDVEVLGTAFNVKAYAADAVMETTLVRGKIEILNDDNKGNNIVLYPNQKVIINTHKLTLKKINLAVAKKPIADSVVTTPDIYADKPAMLDDNVAETAWVDNRLSFKKENFADLAKQLERWYGVNITFDNDAYLPKHFTGTFNNQSIDEVMHALQLTQPFHYAINNNQIHIW